MTRLSSASSRLLKEVGGTAHETGSAAAASPLPWEAGGAAAGGQSSFCRQTDPLLIYGFLLRSLDWL